MDNNFPYADIIFFALVAGFILLRLRSVLGKDVGAKPRSKPANVFDEGRVVSLSERMASEQEEALVITDISNPDVTAGVRAIKAADPQFNLKEFIGGAKGAYEMTVEGFAKDDRTLLRSLLSADLFKQFTTIIDQRKAIDEKHETTLASFIAADVTEASLTRDTAQITVSFVTEQINLVRNGEGNIIRGNPSVVEKVEDVWTFERSIKSRNPNWQIVAT